MMEKKESNAFRRGINLARMPAMVFGIIAPVRRQPSGDDTRWPEQLIGRHRPLLIRRFGMFRTGEKTDKPDDLLESEHHWGFDDVNAQVSRGTIRHGFTAVHATTDKFMIYHFSRGHEPDRHVYSRGA